MFPFPHLSYVINKHLSNPPQPPYLRTVHRYPCFCKNLFFQQPASIFDKVKALYIYIYMPVNSVTLGRLMAGGCGIGGVEKGEGGLEKGRKVSVERG